MSAPARAPHFLRHLVLLWGLRLSIGLNRNQGRRPALAVIGFLLSSLPALFLGLFFYVLMRAPVVVLSSVWPLFILTLLGFVTSAVWCTWPIMSAGVDDHSELSRYAAFPISGFRLLFASTIASLLEPRALFFHAPMLGATIGFVHTHPRVPVALAIALFVGYALLNAAWSRVGLHLVLNVLRDNRSAEMIGGFFVVFLFAASLIPPIDTSWLFAVGGGLNALNEELLVNAAVALSRVPTGFFGRALLILAFRNVSDAWKDAIGIAVFAVIGFAVAYALLLRFYRRVGRGGPGAGEQRHRDPFATTRDRFSTLLTREALDLWRNPRARLLASVPFILAILIKLLSGRDLFVFLFGRTADAWVMGGLSLYGAIVIASTFSQNMFAYDGQGMAVFLSAPVDLAAVVRAKNLLHASAAVGLGLAVGLFYRVYFGAGSFWDWACAMAGIAALLPVLLTAGNFLSVFFPVKFHANLKRRDKLPFFASMCGVAAAAVGSAPFAWTLRLQGRDGVGPGSAATIALGAALFWVVYGALHPKALALLNARRERVLHAITRVS